MLRSFKLIYLPGNAAGAVQRSNANEGLADAKGEGSAVGESIVEVIITICALPFDLNILAAVAEVTRAGANKIHLTMTLIINNAVADIENNDICKVNVLIIAVGVLFTAYKRIIAIFVCHIFHCGGGAAEVLNGEFFGFFITLAASRLKTRP